MAKKALIEKADFISKAQARAAREYFNKTLEKELNHELRLEAQKIARKWVKQHSKSVEAQLNTPKMKAELLKLAEQSLKSHKIRLELYD